MKKGDPRHFYIHLMSDATGTTLHGWVIDVTRHSVEETAAEIQMLLQKKRGQDGQQELLR